MSYVFTSGGIQDLGGKAYALSRLASTGFIIPQWFAVSPLAFEQSLSKSQRAALDSEDEVSRGEVLAGLEPSLQVVEEIRAALAHLPGTQFAVRSSAVEEDGAQDSFAGQLASYLFVMPDDVPRRVAAVWRSGFTPQIAEYRRQRGLPPRPACAPAVLVQCMIDPACSGVAFSADPVSGRREVAVVSAVFGVGTALVGGDADADVYEVNRNGEILRQRIAHKQMRHVFCAAADGGVTAEVLPQELHDERVLSPEQSAAVAEMARHAADAFGQPQDVEWAIADGQLYLLQSRPITTMREVADSDNEWNIWDNSNIIESYSGVTTPLTFSFAQHVYEGVYRQFCRILCVPEKKITAHERTFQNMLGLIRGRVYYNMLNWYRVLALLPGFKFNRRFMEQMMGVRESLPEEIAGGLADASHTERMRDLVSLANMVRALGWNLLTMESCIARFEARLNEALLDPSPPLSEMRLDELTSHYLWLQDKLLAHWDAPLVNDFFAMIFHGALRKLSLKWLGDHSGMLANDLIRGQNGMISAEPAARVRELARIAATDEEFVRLLCEVPAEEVLRAVQNHAEFRSGYEAYLAKFGDRCLEELKLESKSLHEDPQVLLRSIGELARGPQQGSAAPKAGAGASARHAEEQIRRALRRSPLKRLLINQVLRQARTRVRQRENLRFERTRLFGRVRNIFRECGKRLHASGLLGSSEDVFYLKVEEILGYAKGTAVPDDFPKVVRDRKAEFAEYRTSPAPPARFETRGPVGEAQTFASSSTGAAGDLGSDERLGIGCCPGVVRGAVRVILDPRGAVLPAGSILAAEHTDPGWIMLFPSAAGLLVERGSLLSHSAIVARELGIPAVVSIPGLTTWLRDGDLVELDGAHGSVRRISVRDGNAQ
ncbi:MAG TPA: PEP/pyruvate-binding domain-containing protein [Terracidiphilus sp.]|nr:PEP/pyruvate-binding domain-containing protein [Terracidiphilus sp.]